MRMLLRAGRAIAGDAARRKLWHAAERETGSGTHYIKDEEGPV